MKAALLQQIESICQAFGHQMSERGAGLLIDGRRQVSVENNTRQGYVVKYESALHQTHALPCGEGDLSHLVIEILGQEELAEVWKKSHVPDTHEFFGQEGIHLMGEMNALLEKGGPDPKQVNGNRYTLAYRNGWALLYDEVFFQETYPLFIKMAHLQKEMARFLARQNGKQNGKE